MGSLLVSHQYPWLLRLRLVRLSLHKILRRPILVPETNTHTPAELEATVLDTSVEVNDHRSELPQAERAKLGAPVSKDDPRK